MRKVMISTSWRRMSAFGVATVSALVMSVGPAHAAPNWQSWSAPSDYKCGTTTLHYHSANIAQQTCIIRNPNNNTYQAVAIVVNNHSAGVYLRAHVYRPGRSGYEECNKTWVPANTRVACYGDTGAAVETSISSHSVIFLNDNFADGTTTVTY